MKYGFFRGILAGLAVCAAILAVNIPPPFAIAQDVAQEAPGRVSLVPVLQTAIPYMVELFLTGIFALAVLVAKWAKAKWNIDAEARLKEIEARHRAALHSAILSGVSGLVPKFGEKLEVKVGSEELAKILRYIRDSVPDAISALNPTPDVVAKIATAKAAELSAARTPVIAELKPPEFPG